MYIVTGILQGVLLGLAIMYFFAAREQGELMEGHDDREEEDDEVDEDDDERTALLLPANGKTSTRPIYGTQSSARSDASQRQLSMLYAATPPDQDSDRS